MIVDSKDDYDQIEKMLLNLFREEIYLPLLAELNENKKILNAITPYSLLRAIQDGHITFYRGRFKGRFNAKISKELRSIGAVWETKTVSFKFPTTKLPFDIRNAIAVSEAKFNASIKRIDEKLLKLNPVSIASKINLSKVFDSTIYKTEKKIEKTLQKIQVRPNLTDSMKKKISLEYNEDMKKYIQDWSEKEIKKLRANIAENAFSGKRYEGVIDQIQQSYGVSQAKAKFLARQETNLYVTKLQETLYTEAGIQKYKWTCVVGSVGHEVRHSHSILNGKVFRWDSPPVVNENGDRKNPGEDFGCRCYAIPQVEF